MNLTPEEAAIAKARGCRLIAADAKQVAVLSMQRRVFWIQGEPWLIMRGDGFFETAATLRHLLEQPGPAAAPAPEAPATPGAAAVQAAAVEADASGPAPAAPVEVTQAAEISLEAPEQEAPAPQPPSPPLPAPPALSIADGILALGPQDTQPRNLPAALVITANIVSRYVAATPVDTKDLPDLIRSIHRSVCALHPGREGA